MRISRFRHLSHFAILLLAALLLSGCGANGPAPPAPAAAATPRVIAPASPPAAAATNPPVPAAAPASPYLVSAATLRSQLADSNLRIVDLTGLSDYSAGHIPGAIRIDWPDLQVTDTSPASISKWQGRVTALLGARGISAGNRVVIYDHGTLYGARLWWVLDQLGHADKQILDGGFPAWQAAGGSVTRNPTTYPPAVYTAHPQPAVLATEVQVKDWLGQPGIGLVDARSPGEYSGQNTSGAGRGGHIPGAVNVPFNTTAADGTAPVFKDPAAIRALFAAQGITPDRPVVTYCSTGVRASVDYFALRLAGFDQVRVYTGSWAEWGNDLSAPIAK